MMRFVKFILIILMAFGLYGCGTSPYEPNIPSDETLPEMTLEE